ncbi:transcription termination factor NusA [Candidatus Microgenomates bacterium]|nr:transcription termination factor NusA [Candidatus Microgenomates bacterium]
MQQTPRTEFAQALKAIATERGLDPDVIIGTIKQAIVAAYKRDREDYGQELSEDLDYDAVIDSVTGETRVFEFAIDNPSEKKDVTPPGFGRIAAQTAKQVIHQKIREAEKGAVLEEYADRVGTLISGMVLRFDGPNVRVDIGRSVEAILPATERVPNERLNLNQRLTFLLKEITDEEHGRQIILSRADPEFVSKLFAREVPEIASGNVEVKAIARDAGVRTKIAVFSSQPGVDPVGSCVGQKGVRVQAVTNELGGERVDIIYWTDNEEELVKAALAPVEVLAIKLAKKDKEAKVTVPEDQLSIAIGKDGQNVRLAGKITGYKIDVIGDPKANKPIIEEPIAEEEKVEQKEAVTEDQSATSQPADDQQVVEPVVEETPAPKEPAEVSVEEVKEETNEENSAQVEEPSEEVVDSEN